MASTWIVPVATKSSASARAVIPALPTGAPRRGEPASERYDWPALFLPRSARDPWEPRSTTTAAPPAAEHPSRNRHEGSKAGARCGPVPRNQTPLGWRLRPASAPALAPAPGCPRPTPPVRLPRPPWPLLMPVASGCRHGFRRSRSGIRWMVRPPVARPGLQLKAADAATPEPFPAPPPVQAQPETARPHPGPKRDQTGRFPRPLQPDKRRPGAARRRAAHDPATAAIPRPRRRRRQPPIRLRPCSRHTPHRATCSLHSPTRAREQRPRAGGRAGDRGASAARSTGQTRASPCRPRQTTLLESAWRHRLPARPPSAALSLNERGGPEGQSG